MFVLIEESSFLTVDFGRWDYPLLPVTFVRQNPRGAGVQTNILIYTLRSGLCSKDQFKDSYTPMCP